MEMMKAAALTLAAAVYMCLCMDLGMAANYTVGGVGGWTQGIDYQTWASSITFVVGDNLIFRYTPNHNVNEVSAADYGSCSPDNPLQPPFSGGLTVIPLTAPGSRYFICGTGGHCPNGMRVQIDTVAASAPPATPPPSVQPPPPATTPPSVPPPPPATPPPPPTTPPSVPTPPPTSSPLVPSRPATNSPSVPPMPSAHRPVSSPPPLKSVPPSTPPTHSHLPAAPKVSPSTPPSKASPTLSPDTAPTPGSSLPAPSPTSSAVKVKLLSGLIAGIISAMLMFLDL